MAEEIQINVKGLSHTLSLLHVNGTDSHCDLGPGEIKLQITIATDKTVLELKQAVAEKSDVEAERQRLIYSGISLDFSSYKQLADKMRTRTCPEGGFNALLSQTICANCFQDEDVLSTYKISSGHTIHMVKGVARGGNTSSSAAAAAPQPLPTMQTGQNPHDPLTLLNSHLGYGAMAGINPFADMGLNQNDPNMVCSCILFSTATNE